MNFTSTLKTENLYENVRKEIQPWLNSITKHKEVLGVVLMSGLANSPNGRCFFDRYSDIDIVVFLDIPNSAYVTNPKKIDRLYPESIPRWLPDFSFYIPLLSNDGVNVEVNFHQMAYQYEKREDNIWSIMKKEAYCYTSEIFYDPQRKIKALIDKKKKLTSSERTRMIYELLSQKRWYVDVNSKKDVERGLLFGAEDLISKGLNQFVECLYLYNWVLRPVDKWFLNKSLYLNWVPDNYSKELSQILKVREITPRSVDERRKHLNFLWEQLINKLDQEGFYEKESFNIVSRRWEQNRQLKVSTTADDILNRLEITDEQKNSRIRNLIDFEMIENVCEFNKKILTDGFSSQSKHYFKEIINYLMKGNND
ncbi:hypothetical protein [Rummeliibacillus suwonensis]|uniref:hypothetical protein n=1 Tax=Rummeliibacillus suwonensis TaxID=1306154 RepID=UPI001AAF1FA7|nr:hypothetical protein [Rummeliibacillus suwonensis]MBO2535618.1 hypothetical protein [Rummeliibacillus suwonensis]